MSLFIRQARIMDPGGPHHLQLLDLIIQGGRVASIGSNLKPSSEDKILEANGAYLSYSAVDIGTVSGAPGNEQREDVLSLQEAASISGYGKLVISPHTNPKISYSSLIQSIQTWSVHKGVQIYPCGAIILEEETEQMCEFLDMADAGAVAFSEGYKAIRSSRFMLKVLEYMKGVQRPLIHCPHDPGFIPGALMHEGSVSTSLGIKGWPDLSETILMQRDISLVEYIEGSIHWYNLSSAASVTLVREAKAKGLDVRASVSIPHLCFTDEKVASYDTNLKFSPPLRTEEDRMALWHGLKDGTIDYVCSGHQPWEEEHKKLEFPYAAFGAEGLETAYSAFLTYCPFPEAEELWVKRAIQWPRTLFFGEKAIIDEGQEADFILHQTQETNLWSKDNLRSKSKNNPFLGKELKGRIISRIAGNTYFTIQL